MPASTSRCLVSTLSQLRTQASTPEPGVGDAEDLEQLLHRAVLAVAAVHRHEGGVRRGLAQPGDQVEPGVDRHDLVAEALERVLDPRAGAQRDLALERAAALEDGDPAHAERLRAARERHDAARRRASGSTRAPPRAAPAASSPGERAVERHLLAHDLADAADALADVVLAAAGEVQPHRAAPAAVEVGGLARHERHVVAQRPREQVGGVDEVGQRGPDEQAAAGARPLGLGREVLGERVEHRVAARAVDLGERLDVVAPAALLEVGLDHQLRQRRAAEVGGLLAEVDLLEHRRRGHHPAEPDARARGSSRRCRGTSRRRRRRARTAAAAGAPS